MKKQNSEVILGIDPGVNNLGWCITHCSGKLLSWGLVTKTLADLKQPSDIDTFKKNMTDVITNLNRVSSSRSKPDFVMERYMPRGMRRGNQVERINIVIGYLLGKLKYNDVYMIPASSWKNRREKEYLTIENNSIPDHLVDTYTMTLYYLERIKGSLSSKEVRKFLSKINNTDWGWKKKKGIWLKDT